MGQGIRTAITTLVAEDLGIEPAAVDVSVGDTRRVPQYLTAGSWGTAIALPAVHAALRRLRTRLGLPDTGAVNLRSAVAAAGGTRIDVEATTTGIGQAAEPAADQLRKGLLAIASPDYPSFVTFSYIAHFVEVRVEPTTCRIRVPRVVSVADCGRVASPMTATSQVRGGVIWGIRCDTPRREPGRSPLRRLPQLDDGGVPDRRKRRHPADRRRLRGQTGPAAHPVGVKGIGEVAMVGVSAAIGNALFHATGTRFRKLPIRIEDVLASH